MADETAMKPMLGLLVKEAVRLALIDSVLADGADVMAKTTGIEWGEAVARLRSEWTDDEYSIPSDLFARMDPGALAQNVACRLLGSGGWEVNGVYSGNATPRQLLEATFDRPDRDQTAEIAFDMGLKPAADDKEAGERG